MNNEELAKVKVSKPIRKINKTLDDKGETLPEDTGQARLSVRRVHDDIIIARTKPLIKKE